MGTLSVIIGLFFFVVSLVILYLLRKRGVDFATRVFIGMFLGIVLGVAFQLLMSANSTLYCIEWINIIGSGYIRLLQMIVMPLILLSILTAILKLDHGNKNVGKLSLTIILVLICTAVIAAAIGTFVANSFSLSVKGLMVGAEEISRGEYLVSTSKMLENQSIASKILELLPTNIFSDLTGSRSTSTIAVVIFSSLLGIAARKLLKKKDDSYDLFKKGVLIIHDAIMELVNIILSLTPYGVMALIVKIASTSKLDEILQLGNFIIASYIAIILMFCVHLLIILFCGVHPVKYLKNVSSLLVFAFSSRSSIASIPINVRTQTEKLGVEEGIANLSASLGSSIGQNGCAAIYPAMLAVMIAPTVGIDPTSFSFMIKLLAVIAISSFGVAGVGGGATFAALIVLSNLNFPVALVGILISIEPLIDMGRTALNVNGSVVSGIVTNKILR